MTDIEKKENEVSELVKAAQETVAQKSGTGYQSQWQSQLDEAMNKILNREKFDYDLNGDAFYNQYKDKYTRQGQQAMMDTVGQQAALTGGFGNSWAQTAGQQAYHGHLEELDDIVPQLYQLALEKYNAEGDRLLDEYALIGDMDDRDYEKHLEQQSLIKWLATADPEAREYYLNYGKEAQENEKTDSFEINRPSGGAVSGVTVTDYGKTGSNTPGVTVSDYSGNAYKDTDEKEDSGKDELSSYGKQADAEIIKSVGMGVTADDVAKALKQELLQGKINYSDYFKLLEKHVG